MSTTLFDRIKHAWTASQPETKEADVFDTAGRAGEDYFAQRIAPIITKNMSVFRSIRLRDAEQKGHEIDFLVLSPTHLHIIEIKNWSGSVRVDKSTHGHPWIQTRYRTNEELNHGNLLKKLAHLQNSIIHEIERRGENCPPPPQRKIHMWLVFVNDNITIDPSCLEARQKSQYGRRFHVGGLNDFLHEFETFITEAGRVSMEIMLRHDSIERACQQLPTWDTLHLFGGKVLKGNLIWVDSKMGNQIVKFVTPHGRIQVCALHVSHTRSFLWGMTQAIFGYDTEAQIVPVPRNKEMSMIVWMSSVFGLDRLVDVEAWSDYFSRSKKDTVNVPLACKIKFHVCGERTPREFQLNNILRIDLSATKQKKKERSPKR